MFLIICFESSYKQCSLKEFKSHAKARKLSSVKKKKRLAVFSLRSLLRSNLHFVIVEKSELSASYLKFFRTTTHNFLSLRKICSPLRTSADSNVGRNVQIIGSHRVHIRPKQCKVCGQNTRYFCVF